MITEKTALKRFLQIPEIDLDNKEALEEIEKIVIRELYLDLSSLVSPGEEIIIKGPTIDYYNEGSYLGVTHNIKSIIPIEPLTRCYICQHWIGPGKGYRGYCHKSKSIIYNNMKDVTDIYSEAIKVTNWNDYCSNARRIV